MVKVSQLVKFKSKKSRFHIVLLSDQVAKLLLLLDPLEVLFTILLLLLGCVVLPDFYRGVTATSHYVKGTIELKLLILGLDFFNFLKKVDGPNFICMHLESIDANLSLYIPNLDNSINRCWC